MGFDWVKATSACSLDTIFGELGEVVDSDVKSANGLKREGVQFRINRDAVKKLIVSRATGYGAVSTGRAIVFELLATEIVVREMSNEKLLFSAEPILTPEGQCLLKVSGEAELLALWQVSRKALTNLFFGS